jgi:alpha-L-arabinofuranosidase
LLLVSLAWSPASLGKTGASADPAPPGQAALVTVRSNLVLRDELPAALFGFNIHYQVFEQDFWRPGKGVDRRIVPSLQAFPGAIYRYPGGLVANTFSWEDSVGAARARQRTVKWAKAAPARFGVNEYLDFVEQVGGQHWYVLNLNGWDKEKLDKERPINEVAASNARLAALIKKRVPAGPRYYELGNELDRATYQWSHDKYIRRSRANIDAIKAVDPEARFVAFVRDFDWRYRDQARKGQISQSRDLITDVLTELPEVNDISLHSYYDDPGLTHRRSKQIPHRLKMFKNAVNIAKRLRGSSHKVRLWVTEHARGVNLTQPKPRSRAALTSNLQAAVSTADYLAQLIRFPEAQGAALHGLNAGPWQVFDASIDYNDLRPRATVRAMKVLRQMDLPRVLNTTSTSPNLSGYTGGYDVTATCFSDGGAQLGLWVVNRAAQPHDVALKIQGPLKLTPGDRYTVTHHQISGAEGDRPDQRVAKITAPTEPARYEAKVDATGQLTLQVGALSVSTIRLSPLP